MNSASTPSPPFKTSTSFKPLNGHPKELSRITVVLYGVFCFMRAGLEVCSGEDAVLPRPELASKGWWQDSVPWCITVGRLIKSGRGTCRVWNPAMSEHGSYVRRRVQIVSCVQSCVRKGRFPEGVTRRRKGSEERIIGRTAL